MTIFSSGLRFISEAAMATRWGILSAGKISGDFTCVLCSQDSDEHQVIAVAARSKERAQALADKFGIKTAYGSYEELVNNPDIDIIYIGATHTEHHKLSILCLNAGKNVLCEKPVTMTLAAAKDIFALAKEKKLFFMEGFWSRCFPIYHQLRRELTEGAVGDIRMVNVKFFYKVDFNTGAMLPLGCYTVMFADFVFGEKPEKISVQGQLTENGFDEGAVVTLTFSGERIANLVYSMTEIGDDCTATILGTKGYINIGHRFYESTTMTTPNGKYEFPLPEKPKGPFAYGDTCRGFKYEQDHVRDCLKKGLLESPLMTHESSLNIMGIMETALKELGVTFNYPYTV